MPESEVHSPKHDVASDFNENVKHTSWNTSSETGCREKIEESKEIDAQDEPKVKTFYVKVDWDQAIDPGLFNKTVNKILGSLVYVPAVELRALGRASNVALELFRESRRLACDFIYSEFSFGITTFQNKESPGLPTISIKMSYQEHGTINNQSSGYLPPYPGTLHISKLPTIRPGMSVGNVKLIYQNIDTFLKDYRGPYPLHFGRHKMPLDGTKAHTIISKLVTAKLAIFDRSTLSASSKEFFPSESALETSKSSSFGSFQATTFREVDFPDLTESLSSSLSQEKEHTQPSHTVEHPTKIPDNIHST